MANNNNLNTPLNCNGTLGSNIPQNNKGQLDDTDLPRLGGKKKSSIRKSVSFSNDVIVEKVENWKKYNVDMARENEFYKLKQEIKKFKAEQAKKLKEQNECCCQVF